MWSFEELSLGGDVKGISRALTVVDTEARERKKRVSSQGEIFPAAALVALEETIVSGPATGRLPVG